MKGIEDMKLDGRGLRIAIVRARWNDFVVGPMYDGAVASLTTCGVDSAAIETVLVPGAFELPLGAKRMATSGAFDAVVCLGAVIRGGTPHFDYVAGECARGIMQVGIDTGVPVTFGVITADTEEQAVDRAGGKHGNKGADAAAAAVEMANFPTRHYITGPITS